MTDVYRGASEYSSAYNGFKDGLYIVIWRTVAGGRERCGAFRRAHAIYPDGVRQDHAGILGCVPLMGALDNKAFRRTALRAAAERHDR